MNVRKKYIIPFSDEQIIEIQSLTPFEDNGFDPEQGLERRIWIMIAQICIGKAEMVDAGYYGRDREDDDNWIVALTGIAATIMNKFRPGDGQT